MSSLMICKFLYSLFFFLESQKYSKSYPYESLSWHGIYSYFYKSISKIGKKNAVVLIRDLRLDIKSINDKLNLNETKLNLKYFISFSSKLNPCENKCTKYEVE